MKKGFTLIELIAVIVILAVIALITVPVVLNLVADSKKSANERSVELYKTAVENAITQYNLKNPQNKINGKIETSNDGKTVIIGDIIINIKYENNKVKCDTIRVADDGKVYLWDCHVNDSETTYVSNKNVYKDGEVVYFDIYAGKACTEEEYIGSKGTYKTYVAGVRKDVTDYGNSVSGFNGYDYDNCYYDEGITCVMNDKKPKQNTCLKFYAFLDDEDSESVKLLLDHNTTTHTYWTDQDTGYMGVPSDVLDALDSATSSWNGTLTPTKYVYHGKGAQYYDSTTHSIKNDGVVDYEIDYTGYKARLITAEEIAKIVGNVSFNSMKSNLFYFDTLGQDNSEVYDKAKSFYKYGWLYDRLNIDNMDVEKYGMPNVSVNEGESIDYLDGGYWTATASNSGAWSVYSEGYLGGSVAAVNGVRPVIEVLRANLKQE